MLEYYRSRIIIEENYGSIYIDWTQNIKKMYLAFRPFKMQQAIKLFSENIGCTVIESFCDPYYSYGSQNTLKHAIIVNCFVLKSTDIFMYEEDNILCVLYDGTSDKILLYLHVHRYGSLAEWNFGAKLVSFEELLDKANDRVKQQLLFDMDLFC